MTEQKNILTMLCSLLQSVIMIVIFIGIVAVLFI